MADKIDHLTTRVQAVEGKVDHLTTRVQAVEGKVDQLSASVDEGFVEQRQYTEFAFGRLEAKTDAGFKKVEERFEKMDGRFDRLERKLDQFIDVQLKTNQLVDRRLSALEPQRPEA